MLHIEKNHPSRLSLALDRRLPIVATWLAAVGLLADDTFDGSGMGMDTAWAGLLALLATAGTIGACIRHSRRIILEVMSYEHRQIRGEEIGPRLLRRD